MKIAIVTAAVLALGGSAANAASVLSDNFDTDTPQLNWPGDSVFTSTSPVGNSPKPASVDLIGTGTGNDFLPGNGYYIDMDGSSGYGNLPTAGQLTSTMSLAAGTYNLTFDLAGNQRISTGESTVVSVGGVTIATITPSSYLQGFTQYTETFTTSGGQLQFTESGPSDQQGNLLDNISLSAAPEPGTWALMLMGLGGMGAMLRGRRKYALASVA